METKTPYIPQNLALLTKAIHSLNGHARKVHQIYKAGNTGAMIALFVPQSIAQGLVTEDSLPSDQLHITLVHLGKAATIDRDDLLHQITSDLASIFSPMDGTIGGVGRFCDTGEDDAFILLPDIPILPLFRQILVNDLEAQNFRVAKDHGFMPHITLKYLPKGEAIPFDEIEAKPVKFDTLSLVLGDQRFDFPFTGGQSIEKAGARHTSKEFKALNRIIQVAMELGAELPQIEIVDQEPGDDDEKKRRKRRQMIYSAWATRAGARHSKNDNVLIQELHDLAVEMGGVCKRVKGPYKQKSFLIDQVQKNRESSSIAQVKARDAVNNAVKSGKLPHAKTLKCYRCKINRADQYHHPRGYSKSFILTVRPICSKCHRLLTPVGQKADITKAQNDAPNYRTADSSEACVNCRFFAKRVGNQYCDLFNFAFADNYVCDDWQSMEPSLIPGYEGAIEQSIGLIEMAQRITDLK